MSADLPKIAPHEWGIVLEPLDEPPYAAAGGNPWLGTVFFGDKRRAAVVFVLSEAQVEEQRFDLRPVELLVSQTTPR